MTDTRVPLWQKFRVDRFVNGDGWQFRVLCGIFFVALWWHYTLEWSYWDEQTGVAIGYIPWRIRNGETMPAKNFLKVTKARIGGGM
jgi:hypothetical protein